MNKRKAIYDYVRLLLGRGFTAAEVQAIEARLDALDAADVLPAPAFTVLEPFDKAAFTTRFANTRAAKIGDADISRAAARLKVSPAHIRMIMKVESRSTSFDARGRPIILFEPHVFHRRTGGSFSPSSYSYARWRTRPYPRTMDGRWAQMADAADKSFDAALESASWGAFQIMGFHWKALGYASATAFADAMASSEGAHLDALVAFIEANRLADELRACRADNPASCAAFAKGYNGSGFAANGYHRKLAKALA